MVLSWRQGGVRTPQELNTSSTAPLNQGTPIEPGHSKEDNVGLSSNQLLDLEKAPTAQDESPRDMASVPTVSTTGPVHSILGKYQELFIVFTTSLAGFFSPVSANIYFPALNSLARDLRVSNTLINLTLTAYLVRSLSPPCVSSFC